MFSEAFMHTDVFNWFILPMFIFFARMSDVTLATLRNIFLSKSIRYIVPLIGFCEVMIWLVAISQIMKNLHNPACFLAYASGYSMGIFVGIKIEQRLALGLQIMRVITATNPDKLISALVQNNFGVTSMDGQGAKGPVKILLVVVKRKDIVLIKNIIDETNPLSFYSVEDIRNVSHGVFPGKNNSSRLDYLKKVFPYAGNH